MFQPIIFFKKALKYPKIAGCFKESIVDHKKQYQIHETINTMQLSIFNKAHAMLEMKVDPPPPTHYVFSCSHISD